MAYEDIGPIIGLTTVIGVTLAVTIMCLIGAPNNRKKK